MREIIKTIKRMEKVYKLTKMDVIILAILRMDKKTDMEKCLLRMETYFNKVFGLMINFKID